jgi:small subunit ribosomal protein S9
VSDDAERDQGETPEPDSPSEPEAAAEQPEADATPDGADTGQPEPEAPEQPEAAAEEQPEADATPDDAAPEQPEADAPEQPERQAEPEQPQRAKPSQAKGKEVVPGADLEPIAISEEERELTAEERAAREAEEEERRAREAAAAADDEDTIAPRSVSVPADIQIQATGKRKSAVARVVVRAGDGSFQINDRGIDEYFKSSQHQALARQPLVTAGYEGSVDVRVRVHGGGISGQAGAVRHGVARALTELEPELRGDLKRRGLLTRDDRRKERKKAGLKKARKRPQFSKR